MKPIGGLSEYPRHCERFCQVLCEPAVECVGSAVLDSKIIGKRFRGGLVFQAHGLFHHSTLCSRVIKKKKNKVNDSRLFGDGFSEPRLTR